MRSRYVGLVAVLAAGCQADDGNVTYGDIRELSIHIDVAAGEYAANEAPILDVTYTNDSIHPLRVLAWTLPSDELWEDMFRVGLGDESAEYIGILPHRAEPVDSDYVTLEPGESVRGQVDLSQRYDLSTSATYDVEVVASPHMFGDIHDDGTAPRSAAERTIRSNKISLFAEGRSLAPIEDPALEPYYFGIGFAGGCTSSEKNAIRLGMEIGEGYAKDALAFMKNNGNKNKPRYKKWFGKVNEANWKWVHDTFDWMAYRLRSEKITFHCDCDKDWYAYVYSKQPYDIYLCNLYWGANNADKGGTIIHEMSHFVDVFWGTSDIVYGETKSKQLAKDDPDRAATNADNYAYFCEKP